MKSNARLILGCLALALGSFEVSPYELAQV